MDITQLKDITGWIIGFLFLNGIAIVTGIFSIIRSGKLLPKEIEEKDLSNKIKEADLASRYEEIANKAAERAIKTQEKFDILDSKIQVITKKVDEQGVIIEEQAKIIKEQARQLLEAEKEIDTLKCENTNYKAYISALIQQMKKEEIVPIEMSSLNLDDCSNIKKKK